MLQVFLTLQVYTINFSKIFFVEKASTNFFTGGSSNIWAVGSQKKFVLPWQFVSFSLPRSRFKVTGHALYDWLLIGFALRGREKVNLGRVYDRKKLLTEIGDAPLLALAATVGWVLAAGYFRSKAERAKLIANGFRIRLLFRSFTMPPASSLVELEWAFLSARFVSVIIP